MSNQANISYVDLPTGDLEDDMKPSMKDQTTPQLRKMRLFTMLLLFGMFLFFVHKVMFYHRMANVFHFMNQGHPCHHHVRFNPIANDELHPMAPPQTHQSPGQDGSDSVLHGYHSKMGLPEMHPPTHHGGFHHSYDKYHHHMNLHNMAPPEMNSSHRHDDAASHGDIHKPSPPIVLTPENLSMWKIHDHMDSSGDSIDMDSFDDSKEIGRAHV